MAALLKRLKAWEAWEPPGIGGIPPRVTPPKPVMGAEVIAEIERLQKVNAKLLRAAKAGASALDTLMGDSDLDDDQSPEFKACLALNRAVDFAKRKPRK